LPVGFGSVTIFGFGKGVYSGFKTKFLSVSASIPVRAVERSTSFNSVISLPYTFPCPLNSQTLSSFIGL